MTVQHITGSFAKVDVYSRSVQIIASTPNPVQGEALTAWDTSRFEKNPVILWGHDDHSMPIGTASEIEFDPAVGLKMRVTFAREVANPLAEQVFQACIDGIVRAVSVGYEPPEERTRNTAEGTVVERTPAKLIEVSFVSIGADEDAGTAFLNPEVLDDEQLAARVSKAAGELARARARISARKVKEASVATKAAPAAKTRDKDDQPGGESPEQRFEKLKRAMHLDSTDDVLRMDVSRLGKVQRTSMGGANVPARLSRTGVLTYMNADGTKRRELRTAEEIFKADSLGTLEHAPVIDIKDHTGLVTPETWRNVTLGHVTGVRHDGKFISSNLVIQDGATLDAIEKGERTEISCGYRCRLDNTPGIYEGEAYDCVQRDIRYNHAALCPPNRGRAGPEVGLRLDANNQLWATAHLDKDEEKVMKMIRLDGRDYEVGSDAHVAKLEEMSAKAIEQVKLDSKTTIDAATAKHAETVKDLQVKLDKAEGARDAAVQTLETERTDAKTRAKDVEQKEADKEAKRKATKTFRRKLERLALKFFAGDKDKGDEDKMDALSDRDLMLQCIQHGAPNFDAKDKSDDYVTARFDSLCEQVQSDNGIEGVRRTAEDNYRRMDANETDLNDPIAKGRAARDKAAYEAGRTVPKTA